MLNIKNVTTVMIVAIALAVGAAGITTFGHVVNGQNATMELGNVTSSDQVETDVNGQNATMELGNVTSIDQVETDVLETLAASGWANTYDVLVDEQSTPINYNIIGGQLVGMLANPDRHALYLALNPQPDGGAVEVQLPRNFIDSKTSENEDKPYVVIMDGDRISGEPTGICIGDCPNIFNSFSQTAESSTERVLTIVFGPDSRFVEIIGDRGA